MTFLARLAIFTGKLSNVAGYVGILGLVSLFLIVTSEILLRTFFNMSLEFNITISQWLLICLVWMAGPMTLKAGGHIQVEVFTSRLAPKSQAKLKSALYALGACFFLVFSWYAWGLFLEHYDTGATEPSVWRIPKWYGWLPFCLGSAILPLQFLGCLAESLISIERPEGADKEEIGL
jgi:TRAP-type C4-dicarboxylate transport system permease small subunit